MMSRVVLVSAVIFLQAFSMTVLAESAQEKGLEIAMEMDRRDEGFRNYTVDMEMVLKNRHGEESIRYMRSKTLEVIGDGDKSISVFDRPKDIKGTAMLTFTHKKGPDDQWLYLPALKRVKRISSSNKSGSFMGSEFAYEDLSSQEVEKYTYKYIRDDEYEAQKSFVLERYPVDKHSGYTKQVAWIDQAEYRVLKIEFYDRKKTLLKTLTFGEYHQFVDKYWRPGKLYMQNHQTGKSTTLLFSNFKFRTSLTEKDFNKNSLKRVR